MELSKPNDIFVATLNNPEATSYDLMSLNINPENTSLYSKDEYKQTKLIQDKFKDANGVFDDLAFDEAFNKAQSHYKDLTDDAFLKSLDEVQYSPFDISRPKDAKTFKIDVEYSKEYNPFKETYSRTGINSISSNTLSMRELAQQEKVFDPITNSWSKESANDLSIFNKFFVDTLVYAQWDEDGFHVDPETGRTIKHRKGDWKVNSNGHLYLEKLGDREVYGKQVVNPMDLLTTDGSFANDLDFFDSDSKEKSALKTTLKLAADIAPLMIPGVNTFYGGFRAAIGLISVMPTFYKSLEGILMADTETTSRDIATAAENYMAKFKATSTSDEAQSSLFNYEQMSGMVSDIFSQIYEQRAMASLSKYLVRPSAKLTIQQQEISKQINQNILNTAIAGKLDIKDGKAVKDLYDAAISKLPELKSLQKAQSGVSKALSLGYMALTSTGEIYGEALEGGYDRRTAGFAALAAAAGQYGIMMNNEMGTWFLDKTTGYNVNANRALIKKSISEYLKPIKEGFDEFAKNPVEGKVKLAGAFKSIKTKLQDVFTNPSELGEAMWKNAFIEGVEEVTEQAVLDATKGIIDTLSYLGITKKEGSFGGWSNVFSKQGFENYLANLVGGVIGGGMFELQASKIEPLFNKDIVSKDTKHSVYKLVGNGQTQLLIDEINKQRKNLGNKYLTPYDLKGNAMPAEQGMSQADVIADSAIKMIKNIDGIMNSKGLVLTDKEIIDKAMLDHIIIKDLEASKGEGKIGIEGLVVDDFRKSSNRIMDIQLDIAKLSASPEEEKNNLSSLNLLKEESAFHESRINSILNGELAEKYYNEALFYLSKDISKDWLIIDKETFTYNKYGKDYKSLSAEGVGITQKRIDQEWADYKDSKNLRNNIEVATSAYLNLEKELNPTLFDYMSSGYAEERVKTYKNLIDLDGTIKMFNTATSPEEKQKLIDRFIYINEELKKNSKSKLNIVPWDVYKLDFGKNLIKYGMVGKQLVDEKGVVLTDDISGQVLTSPYTEQELEEVNDAGIKSRDSLEQTLNMLLSEVPINPLDIDGSIKILNSMIQSANMNIDKNIMNISKKGELSEEDLTTIKELQASKYNIILLPFNQSSEILKKNEEVNLKLTELFKTLENDHGLSEKTIDNFRSNNYYNLNDSDLEEEYKSLEWLINVPADEINDTFVEGLTTDQIESFEKSSLNRSVNQQKDLYNRLVEAKQKINSGQLIKDKEGALEDVISEEEKIKEDFESFVEKSKPAIFRMRNYALDLILDQLKSSDTNSPNLDGEIIMQAEKMVSEITNGYMEEFFPDFKFQSVEDLMFIVNNAVKISDKINTSKTINVEVKDEDTEEISIETNYTKEAILGTNLDDIVNKYITDNIGLNISFIEGIRKLANVIDTLNGVDQVNMFLEMKQKGITGIDNSLYKFLENFGLSLYPKTNKNAPSVFDILEREDKSLMSASDINNYLTEGIKLKDIQDGINLIKLVKSATKAMSTTQVSFEEPYGFIASRQAFVKKNNIESEAGKLKVISSDIATLMVKDLDRLQTKLQFYLDLARGNYAKVMNEQELIRTKMTDIFMVKLKTLVSNPSFAPIKDKLDEIYKNTSKSNERKLMEIESLIYENFKDSNKEETLKNILSNFDISIDGRKLSIINKDVKESDIADYDFAVYIASIISVNSRDFNVKMHSILQDFDKAPFYTQELAVKSAYASLINPELFSLIVSLDKTNSDKNVTELITYVLGGAGVGKTTVVFKMLMKYIQKNNPSINMWLVGPEQDQADKLNRDVTSDVEFVGSKEALSKSKLYEKLGIRNEMAKLIADLKEGKDDSEYYKWDENGRININPEFISELINKAFKDEQGNINKNLPNLIFIDEITHFSSIELEILNTLVKSLPKNNFIKIIGAGDTSQAGFKYGNNMEMNVDRVSGIFTPKLLTTVRASNTWKRENNDLAIQLSEKVSDIYNDPALTDVQAEKTRELLETYKIKKLFNLKYHQSENVLNGDIIVDTLNASLLTSLKNIITNNPDKTVGILTEFGKYDDYIDALSKVGLVLPDGKLDPRIKVFTADNIQGNEVDYFIFDTKLIKSSQPHHKLKDFYTLMSRSKDASIIIDSAKLANEFNIINSAETFTEIRTPLSKEIIDEARKARIDVLAGMLDNQLTVNYDNFKFGEGELEDRTDLESTFLSEDDAEKVPININSVIPVKVEDDFNYMFHTFYNNANIPIKIITDNSGNITGTEIETIKYDAKNGKSDLNIAKVSDKDKDKVIEGWFSIKNYYTYNKTLPKDSNSTAFLKALFGSSITPDNVKTSIVLTAKKYDPKTNTPVYKDGFDITQTLKEGDIFINVSLKLENEGKFHYITLATISANTIESSFGSDSKSNLEYKRVLSELKTMDIKGIIEIADNITFDKQITSVRFLKGKKKKTYVKDISSTYKGLRHRKVKFFPTSEAAFYELMNRYSFGEKRKVEDTEGKEIGEHESEKRSIPGLKSLFERYKGKAYIEISYNSEDLDGSTVKDVQAKLVPVFSESRPFDQARKEMLELRDLYFSDQVKKDKTNDAENVKLTADEKATIASTFKNIISTTQLIDILIAISEDYPEVFDALLSPTGKFNTIPIDIIAKVVPDKSKEIVKTQIKGILNTIKDLRGKKSREEIKKQLWPLLVDNTWKNYISNILILDKLIENERNKAKESDVKEIYNNMLNSVSEFYSSFKTTLGSSGIFWEIPKSKNEVVTKYDKSAKSDVMKKLQKYQPESYLYMTAVPESPRFLVNLEKAFKGEPAKEKEEEGDGTKKDEKKEKEKKKHKEKTTTSDFKNLMSFYGSKDPNGWKYLISDLMKDLTPSQIMKDPVFAKIYDLLGIEEKDGTTVEKNDVLSFEGFMRNLIPDVSNTVVLAGKVSSLLSNSLINAGVQITKPAVISVITKLNKKCK